MDLSKLFIFNHCWKLWFSVCDILLNVSVLYLLTNRESRKSKRIKLNAYIFFSFLPSGVLFLIFIFLHKAITFFFFSDLLKLLDKWLLTYLFPGERENKKLIRNLRNMYAPYKHARSLHHRSSDLNFNSTWLSPIYWQHRQGKDTEKEKKETASTDSTYKKNCKISNSELPCLQGT